MMPNRFSRWFASHPMAIPVCVAMIFLGLQVAFHNNYGYFRDELYYIACSNHLAWGYVDQPPFSIGALWIARMLLGDSLQALRFLPSLAGAATVLLTALMARRMGGGPYAQGLAAFAVLAAHTLLGQGRYFSMNAFDILFWTLGLFLVARILAGDSPKLWLVFGIVAGLGLLNKYSIGFLCIGLAVALLLTKQRAHLFQRWFWMGSAIAGLLILPHLLWEIHFGFPSLEFMRNASQLKNAPIGLAGFTLGQLKDMNLLNAPLWIGGIVFFLFAPIARPFRAFGWMFLVVFALMVAGNAKIYYLSPIYPLFFAGGAIAIERLFSTPRVQWLRPAYVILLAAVMLIGLPMTLPVLPPETLIAYQNLLGQAPRAEEHNTLGPLPQYYADEFGWEEMVAIIGTAYQTLSPREKAECVIYLRNYGEAGAVDFFGKRFGLPPALCAHNSYWYWGPGDRSGNVAIIVGAKRTLEDNKVDLERAFTSVEYVGFTHCDLAMPYENGKQIFICRGAKIRLSALWDHERFFI